MSKERRDDIVHAVLGMEKLSSANQLIDLMRVE